MTIGVEQFEDRVVVTLCRPEARNARSGQLALRLTKLVADALGGHPIIDDLAQAILFESDEKRARMNAFLSGSRR